jgi:hypothetical protein
MVHMRDRRATENQSVLIASALGVFALALTLEGLAGWVLHSALDLEPGNAISGAAVLLAAALAIAFLVRSDRS